MIQFVINFHFYQVQVASCKLDVESWMLQVGCWMLYPALFLIRNERFGCSIEKIN